MINLGFGTKTLEIEIRNREEIGKESTNKPSKKLKELIYKKFQHESRV